MERQKKYTTNILLLFIPLFLTTFCMGYSTDEYLNGKFINTETQAAPVALGPADNENITVSTVFTWTGATDALSYRVEFSTVTDFSSLILSATTDTPSYTIQTSDLIGVSSLPEGSYYWRVITVYPTKEEVSPALVFNLLSSTIVYVDINNLGTESGSKSFPFRSIQRGLNFAQLNGQNRVLVSKGTYNEVITMAPGVSLEGGYDAAASWSRDIVLNTTTITSSLMMTLYVPEGATSTTIIDGFTINTSSTTAPNYAIYLSNTSPVIKNNTITTPDLGTTGAPKVYGIYATNGSAPVISSNTFLGGNSWQNYIIYMDYSSATITNNTINGGTGSTNISIFEYYSSSTITNNTITGATKNGGQAITIGYGSTTTVQNNTLTGCNNTVVLGTCAGLQLQSGSAATISNNTINGGTNGTFTYGIYGALAFSGTSVVSGNVISAGNGTTKSVGIYLWRNTNTFINNIVYGGNGGGIDAGIYIYDLNTGVIANNTILAGTGATNYGIFLFSNSTGDLQNNIIYCTPGATSLDYGIWEDDATSNPTLLQNNNIYGCASALYVDYVSTGGTCPGDVTRNCYSTEADLNTAANTTQGAATSSQGNVVIDNTAGQLFVDQAGGDFHLTTNAAICNVRAGGMDLSAKFTVDYDALTRTISPIAGCTPTNTGAANWSIGAFEKD